MATGVIKMVEDHEIRERMRRLGLNPDLYPEGVHVFGELIILIKNKTLKTKVKQRILSPEDKSKNIIELVMKRQEEEILTRPIDDPSKEILVHNANFDLQKSKDIPHYFSVSEENSLPIKSSGEFSYIKPHDNITMCPYKPSFFEKFSKWFNRGLKYGLALSLLSILPLNNFDKQPLESNFPQTPRLTLKVINVEYEINYDEEIDIKNGLLSAIQKITGLKGKKLIEKNEEIVDYNELHHPNRLVRERIGYDLMGFKNGKKVMEEDGIRGDYIPSEYVLYPTTKKASKPLTALVNENNQVIVNEKTLSIDDYIKRNIPKDAVVKEIDYPKEEEKYNNDLTQIYNNHGIKKARELSKLSDNEIYSRLDDSRKQGSTIKYSSSLINNMPIENRYDFWRTATSIYLNGKTVKDSLKQIEKETGIKMSESTMYRGITRYTDEIGISKIRKLTYMKWKPILYS